MWILLKHISVQVARSYQNISMQSMRESSAYESSNRKVAVYKGLTVAVYAVDKYEINLTRQDLIELINVCNFSFLSIYFLTTVLCRSRGNNQQAFI